MTVTRGYLRSLRGSWGVEVRSSSFGSPAKGQVKCRSSMENGCNALTVQPTADGRGRVDEE